MNQNRKYLEQYILGGGLGRVAGWLSDGAISITLAINEWQRTRGIKGDVAEIGIHHGKFFLVLKNTCQPGETAFAVDVFGDQHLNPDGSGKGDRARFEAHLAEYSDNKGLVILQKDSLTLCAADLSTATHPPRIRLFSVDGSHTAEHTLSDLKISSAALGPGGVIILDDFSNPEWPGVQEGFHRFMFDNRSRFAAVAYGDNKMIICRAEDHASLSHFLRGQLPVLARWHKIVRLHGREATAFRMKGPSEVFGADLRLKRVLLPQSEMHCCLLAGWGQTEVRGVWSVDQLAELEVDLDGSSRGVQLIVHPFLPATRRTRGLTVSLGNQKLAERAVAGPDRVIVELPMGQTGPTTLSLTIEQPERPVDFGGSDVRRLGFLLYGIKKH